MLKKILLFVLVLFAAYLGTCFFGPKSMDCSVKRTIPYAMDAVYEQMADFKNWPNWSVWMKRDSLMKLTYGEKTTGVGGHYDWTSPDKNSGSGSMDIQEMTPNQSINMLLTFKDWDSKSNILMTFKALDATKTEVNWDMKNEKDLPFMMRGMMLFMGMPAAIQKDFNQSFDYLEAYLKTAPPPSSSYTVSQGNFKGGLFLMSKRRVVKFADIGNFFNTEMPKIGQLAANSAAGMPCGFYWKWDEEKQETDMAAAIPISAKVVIPAETHEQISIPLTKEFTVDYYGAYEKTMNAYKALDRALASQNIAHPEMVIEEYISDPMVEKDTTKWLTRIHFLVK